MAVGTVSGVDPANNWQLISTTTISSGTANYTLNGFDGYKTIMVLGKNIVKSADQITVAQFNGVTSGGVYNCINANGSYFFTGGSHATSGTITMIVNDVDKSIGHQVEFTGYSAYGEIAYYTDPVPITSIKIYNNGGATYTSGTIYVYGIPA